MNSGLVPSSVLCLRISRFESWVGDYYGRQNSFSARRSRTKWDRVFSLVRLHDHTQIHHIRQVQHSRETEMHDPGGIRTRNISRRAAAYVSLRPRGHWNRLTDKQDYRGFHAFLKSYNRNRIFKKALTAFFRTPIRRSE
jgi:hypothetical protein